MKIIRCQCGRTKWETDISGEVTCRYCGSIIKIENAKESQNKEDNNIKAMEY